MKLFKLLSSFVMFTGLAFAQQAGVTVEGTVSSGATDAGKSVKIGCVFNTTQPTVTNGQRADCQATNRGALIVSTGLDVFNVTIQSNASVNLNQVGGSTITLGQKTMSASVPVVPASDYIPTDTVGTLVPLNGSNVAASVAINGQLGVSAIIGAGTLAGTVTPEISTDGGTTWTATYFALPSGQIVSTRVYTNPNSADQLTVFAPPGASNARVRVSSFTSGTANATLRASEVDTGQPMLFSGPVNTIAPPHAAQIGGSDGTNIQALRTSNTTPGGSEFALITRNIPSGIQAISATSLPLPTGASTSANQPALGTAGSASADVITVQGIASMTAIKVDGSAVTQPISAASLPLPSGASISAKQPALGTAGTASSDVITVQGITSMTALKVDGSAVTQPVSGTITATQATGTNLHMVCDSGCSSSAGFADSAAFTIGTTAINPVGGLFDDTPPTAITTGHAASARITANRALHINLRNQAGTEIGTSGAPVRTDPTGTTTQPVSGTITANIGTPGSLALDASVTGLEVSQGSTTSGEKGALMQGAVTTAAPTYTAAQTSPLSLTTAGALRVDNSAVTQPISAAALPLPSGASTSAKQPALGTAGSASVDVITIQGITSMTAVKVDGSAVTQPVSGTITATQATGTNLHMVCDSGCSSSAGFADNAAFTTGTTAINPVGGLFDDTPPTAIVTGHAASARITNNRALHINLRNQAGTEIGTSGAPVRTDPTGTTTQPVSGTVTANIGTVGSLALDASVTGLQVAQSSTTSGEKGQLQLGAVTAGAPTYTTAQSSPLSLTTAGALRIDGSGVTQPVSGTVAVSTTSFISTQATAANLNAQVVGNIASGASDSGNPVKMGGVFNTTQPTVTTGQRIDEQMTARGGQIVSTGVDVFHVTVDSAPTTAVTGTVTANAGTNLNTSALALDTSVNGLLLSQASTTSGQKGGLTQGAVTTNAPTYTTAQTDPLSLDTSGLLRISLKDTPQNTSAFKVDGSAVTQPVSGTVTANAGTNLNTSALALDASISNLDADIKADPCGDGHAKSYAFYDASTNGATQLVPLSSGKIVYVCAYSFSSSSATANTLKLVYGTASNCSTGQTAITPGIVLQAAASTGPIGKMNSNSAGLQTIASNELCVLTNAAQPAQAEVSYVQQ